MKAIYKSLDWKQRVGTSRETSREASKETSRQGEREGTE